MTTTNVTAAQADAGLWNTYGGKPWSGTITYSVPGTGAVWDYGNTGSGEPTDANYGTFDGTQGGNFRSVMELWDSYVASSMTEVSDSNPGQIRVAFTDVTARKGSGVAAYAYGPSTGSEIPVAGDIWVDETYKSAGFARGDSTYELLIHESGHALGLKHSFESPTVPSGYDSTIYTVMSYTHPDWFYTWSGDRNSYSVTATPTVDYTPMVLDIRAMQGRYGADTATNAGATTYVFTDASLNGRQAIYDAAGTDTINLSALSRGSKLDLRPGAYSDLAYYAIDDQIDDLAAIYGEDANTRAFITQVMKNPNQPAYEWTKNLGLSFTSSIENAVGSASADEIIGNSLANTLNGGGGSDVLKGLTGDDTYYVDNTGDRVLESAGGGTDRVYTRVDYTLVARQEIERLSTIGNATSTTAIDLTGNDLVQTISGNKGANRLDGKGGADTLYGYGGKDAFLFTTTANAGDRIADFSHADDTMHLSRSVFKALTAGTLGSTAFKDLGVSGARVDGDDRILYNHNSGALSYDPDGSGTTASAVQFATLVNKPANLDYSDFLVVA